MTLHTPKQRSSIAIITEAYSLTSGFKWLILKRALLIMAFVVPFLLLMLIITNYSPINLLNLNTYKRLLLSLIFIPVNCLILKLWVPMLMVGVRQSIGLKIELKKIKLDCSLVKTELWKLILIYIFIAILLFNILTPFTGFGLYWVVLNFIQKLIMFFILAPLLFFAFPVLITQKITAFSAVISAYKRMSQHWMMVMVCCVILYVPIKILYGILFGIALYHPNINYFTPLVDLLLSIWLIPLIVMMGGILFREAYALKRAC